MFKVCGYRNVPEAFARFRAPSMSDTWIGSVVKRARSWRQGSAARAWMQEAPSSRRRNRIAA